MQETQKSKMALEHGIVSTTNFTHNHQPPEAAKILASLCCLTPSASRFVAAGLPVGMKSDNCILNFFLFFLSLLESDLS